MGAGEEGWQPGGQAPCQAGQGAEEEATLLPQQRPAVGRAGRVHGVQRRCSASLQRRQSCRNCRNRLARHSGQGIVLQVAGCCRHFQLQSGDSVQDRVCGRGPGALQHCRLQSGLGPGRPSVLAPHCSLQSADPLVCCWARAS